MRSAKPRFAYTTSLRMPVSASDARSRPSAIDGRWTSAKGMQTRTTSTGPTSGPCSGGVGAGRSRSVASGGADACSLAVSVMEGPRLLESTDGARHRSVVPVHPVVILPDLGEQARLLALLVLGEAIQVAGILFQLRHGGRLDVVHGAAERVARHLVADRGEVAEIAALRVRDAIVSPELQLRLEEQPPEDVAESLVREVPDVEGADHPLVEVIQLRVQELVVRLERRPQQAAFRLESALDRRARVRQHPAERRYRPAVADEGFEEIHVLP